MDGRPADNTLPTHTLHLPKKSCNIIKGLAESAFGESQPVKYVVGDTGGERVATVGAEIKRVWGCGGNGLQLLAGGKEDLGCGQGEAVWWGVVGAVLHHSSRRGSCGGRRTWCKAWPYRVPARGPARGHGLSSLPGTCVTVTSEETTTSDDYPQVISKAFFAVRSHEPRKVPSENALWGFQTYYPSESCGVFNTK